MSEVTAESKPLPVGPVGTDSVGWWGFVLFITTEACLFGYLFFSYAYFAVQLDPSWVPNTFPSLKYAIPATVAVVLNSITMVLASRASARNSRGGLVLWWAIGLLLGLAFVALELLDWSTKNYGLNTDAYSSFFYTITGAHLAHLFAGLLALILAIFWAARGYFSPYRNTGVLMINAYWHFVNAVWIITFVLLYLWPYLGPNHG